ncbi:MAG: hypothetical protein KatS3mg107_0644 [Gemmataceae bacterium]|nr:MAG: hypothetical protein KatS3mg107_0644 [Gemmataceae bacterium]
MSLKFIIYIESTVDFSYIYEILIISNSYILIFIVYKFKIIISFM